LLIFGLGVSAKAAFGALHGIFPVALFAIGAMRNLSPSQIRTARNPAPVARPDRNLRVSPRPLHPSGRHRLAEDARLAHFFRSAFRRDHRQLWVEPSCGVDQVDPVSR
jgi:hypothetical protein